MALPKLFQRIFWHNNTTPALNEDNLNAMSKGLSDVDDRVIELGSTIMEIGPKIINAEKYALDSEAWAQGTRDGTPVSSDDETYENNSKWYSQQASSSASSAYAYMQNANQSAIDAEISAGNASTSASNAVIFASNASTSALIAQNHALDAEAWAVGQRNGADVSDIDVTHNNNSKYYAQAAETTKSQIMTVYQDFLVYNNLLVLLLGTINLTTENGDQFVTENGDYIGIDY